MQSARNSPAQRVVASPRRHKRRSSAVSRSWWGVWWVHAERGTTGRLVRNHGTTEGRTLTQCSSAMHWWSAAQYICSTSSVLDPKLRKEGTRRRNVAGGQTLYSASFPFGGDNAGLPVPQFKHNGEGRVRFSLGVKARATGRERERRRRPESPARLAPSMSSSLGRFVSLCCCCCAPNPALRLRA